jgi:hypothetical protein
MTTALTIRWEAGKVSTERYVHCSSGWVYEVDPDTGEDIAMGCWMCPEGKAIEPEGASGSRGRRGAP